MNDLKRNILEKGIEKLLDEAKVPYRHLLGIVKSLNERIVSHQKDIQTWDNVRQSHERILKDHEIRNRKHDEQNVIFSDKIEKAVERVNGLEPRNGIDGRDADEHKILATVLARIPKEETIVGRVMTLLPKVENGKDGIDGDAGKDADEQKIIQNVLERIQKEQLIDVSHIRNLQGFVKNGVRYRFEELMKGGGSTGSGSGTTVVTQYSVAVIQSGNDVTIDLTQLTHWATFSGLSLVIRNNLPQTQTLNFTLVGSVVTVFNADAGEIFNIQYAYS